MVLERPEPQERTVSFLILGQHVQVRSLDPSILGVIEANYQSMAVPVGEHPPDLQYTVAGDAEQGSLFLTRPGQPACELSGLGEMLFLVEKDITVALQERRPDLLFLHAAALEYQGKAYVLAGDSGNGKSTTAWGLLHHGFRYLSDELSPIEPDSLLVHSYAHALCLKQRPPQAYPLPSDGVLDLGETLHVPVHRLPNVAAPGPCQLAAVFFVRHDRELRSPVLRSVGTAEAGARIYATTLNALAHPALGLDAAVHIAERVPCFALDSADLGSTCDLVLRMVEAAGLNASTEIDGRPAL